MSDSKQGQIEVNGAQLYYEVAGSGPALVFIHAGIADCRMWDAQFAAFVASHRVVRYDQRGYGRSSMPAGDYSLRDDLYGLLRALGIERATLVGTSMGGGVALDCALDHPEFVAGLVLVASGLGGSLPSDFLRGRWQAIGEAYERDGVDAANELELQLWIDGPGRTPEQTDPALRALVREMNRAVLEREAENDELGQPQRLDPPAIGRLGEIAAPTLVIAGDNDVPDIIANAERLAGGIAGARKVVLPDVSHLPPLERPDEFNRLLRDFLAATQAR
jgi:pimeloyl-ACP methyl ester carboxylesterase